MRRLLLLLALLLCQTPVWAHKASDSYLSVQAQGAALEVQWDIALRDIDFALGLDRDGNAEITWGELRARQSDIVAWAITRLDLSRGGACPLSLKGMQVDTHTDGGYAVLHITGNCPAGAGDLGLQYRLLFDLDNLHRGLLNLSLDGVKHTAVLSPASGLVPFSPEQVSRWRQFAQYLVEGVWHIWIGFDHILFLLSLLLPAVLVVQGKRWRGVERLGEAAREVLWVVTSFTVAHSITLSLAVLGLVSLPSRLVESAIALSVVLAAANNLWPVVEHRRWLVAFGFGLIHGFGFASVLSDYDLLKTSLLYSLAGFNIGVEFGQLAIVSIFLPLAYLLRKTKFYQIMIVYFGSVLCFLIALIWFLERSMKLQIFSALF